MQTKCSKKVLSSILCMVLILSIALFTTGCNDSKGNDTTSDSGTKVTAQEENDTQTEAQTKEEAPVENSVSNDSRQLGEGNTKFTFIVVDKEGNETTFEIHTDKETVGEALEELELIAGDESEFGLYVKTVNGITADYDKDGVYWAFYINDEYAKTGVDSTQITEGDRYSFRIE